MFRPLQNRNRRSITKSVRAGGKRNRYTRPLSFENIESRTMLSASSVEVVEETPLTVLPADVRTISTDHPAWQNVVGQTQRSFTLFPADGGFLSVSGASVNYLQNFSGRVNHANNAVFVDSFSFSSSNATGITLDFGTLDGPAALSEFSGSVTPVMSPIAIIGPETHADLKAPNAANGANKTSGDQGGAIRIESILRPIVDNGRNNFITPVQRSEFATADSLHSATPGLSIAPVNTISGELARAVVFEMAGGEPIQKNNTEGDVKLHNADQEKAITSARGMLLSSVQEAESRKTNSFKASGQGMPTAAAVAATMNVFMLGWNWFDSAFPVSTLHAAEGTEVQGESKADVDGTLSGKEQAAFRLNDETEHAALGIAPVLIALALERNFSHLAGSPTETVRTKRSPRPGK
jgi:hypothetical protein